MAIEHTDRMGLPTYTSGTDLHPTREDFNERMELIDQLAAIYQSGPRDERPLPSTPGVFYVCTDDRMLYVDTGTEWVDVRRLGHGGPGQPLDIGASEGSEGESDRSARSDHTHPLPLASASQDGAMSAGDKTRLDGATEQDIAHTLLLRNSNGNVNIANPSASTHIANRGYVDQQRDTRAPSSHNHSASDVNAGVLDPDRLPEATQSDRGAMSADDKTKLDEASWDGEPGTLVQRAGNSGRVKVGDPIVGDDAANKGYVDAQRDTRAPSSHSHDAGDITGTFAAARLPLVTGSSNGAMRATDKQKLDGATASADPGTLMRRGDDGRVRFSDPTHASDGSTKRYVDDEVSDAVPEGTPVYQGSSTTDLDNMRTPGYYEIGTETTNAPTGTMGMLEVIVSHMNSARVVQRYTSYSLNDIFYRTSHQDFGWNSWQRIVTETV